MSPKTKIYIPSYIIGMGNTCLCQYSSLMALFVCVVITVLRLYNPVVQLDSYPLPRIDDLFSKLAGGTIFSKSDLTHAYEQLGLDENSQKTTTIKTHKGLF